MTKLTRRKIVKAIGTKGYGRRTGEKVLTAVINLWTQALVRKEPIQVPTGWIVTRRRLVRRVFRLGLIVDIPKRNRSIMIIGVTKPKEKDWIYAKLESRPVQRKSTFGQAGPSIRYRRRRQE